MLHVNQNDVHGGAARAAHRLHTSLREAGCESSMYVQHRSSEDPTVIRFVPPTGFLARGQRWLRRQWLERWFDQYREVRPDGYEAFTQARSQYGGQAVREMPSGDLVHLHWIRNFVDLGALFTSTTCPVVWTLHDMNAMTGGCHYDAGCGRFRNGCGSCPQLGSDDPSDLSRAIWTHKRDLFSHVDPDRLHIVALCEWMARLVRESPLLRRFPVTVIPNGLDPSVFEPCDNLGAVRQQYDTSKSARVVLFVAQSTANRRKGFDLLRDALGTLSPSNTTFWSVGSSAPDVPHTVDHRHLGHVDTDTRLARIYSASDLFVLPSRQDNLPNTVLESMACGTPVVAFDVGGIPDMVRPNETGWLAKAGDVQSLKAKIEQALQDSEQREQMGAQCREVVLNEYTLERQAQNYRELYESICT